MRDVEDITNELKEGATLIINNHKEGKVDHCNGYLYSKDGMREEVRFLRVFIRYINIINEVKGNKVFILSKNEENGKYLSAIYANQNIMEDKFCEEDYLFDSIVNLNEKLKKTKKLGGIYGR